MEMIIPTGTTDRIKITKPSFSFSRYSTTGSNSGEKLYLKSSEHDMIHYWIKSASAETMITTATIPKPKPIIYEDDPEIAAMSNEELTKAALALCGSWADRTDIDDNWLDNLRSEWSDGWKKRLDDLYGSTS